MLCWTVRAGHTHIHAHTHTHTCTDQRLYDDVLGREGQALVAQLPPPLLEGTRQQGELVACGGVSPTLRQELLHLVILLLLEVHTEPGGGGERKRVSKREVQR